jgi:hypothetical protein
VAWSQPVAHFTDRVRGLVPDSAADLLAISPRICGMTTAQAKSVGGLAEPAGEVVVQVLLIVADPGDVAVGA